MQVIEADSHSRNDARRKAVAEKATTTKTERTAFAQKLVTHLENPSDDEATKQQKTTISSIAILLEKANIIEEEVSLRQKALVRKEKQEELQAKEAYPKA